MGTDLVLVFLRLLTVDFFLEAAGLSSLADWSASGPESMDSSWTLTESFLVLDLVDLVVLVEDVDPLWLRVERVIGGEKMNMETSDGGASMDSVCTLDSGVGGAN